MVSSSFSFGFFRVSIDAVNPRIAFNRVQPCHLGNLRGSGRTYTGVQNPFGIDLKLMLCLNELQQP